MSPIPVYTDGSQLAHEGEGPLYPSAFAAIQYTLAFFATGPKIAIHFDCEAALGGIRAFRERPNRGMAHARRMAEIAAHLFNGRATLQHVLGHAGDPGNTEAHGCALRIARLYARQTRADPTRLNSHLRERGIVPVHNSIAATLRPEGDGFAGSDPPRMTDLIPESVPETFPAFSQRRAARGA